MSEVFIGRQPILDRNNKIFGYELLFRAGPALSAEFIDSARATARVMVNTLSNIGIQKLIGDRKGFVNIDEEILESDLVDLLPKYSTILEILESVVFTPKVVDMCKNLKQAGYILALDDFVYSESWSPDFGFIDYVKIDVLTYDRETLASISTDLKKHQLKLIAEKVETREDFEYCRDLGFGLFQGYFFEKPSVIVTKSISPTQIVLIELYKLLSREAEFSLVEDVFKRNPELYFKLLKFINSARFYTARKITSIRQSLTLLGYRNMQKWVSLLLYSGEGEDMKSSPLLEQAAIRGRTMELLAKKITGNDTDGDSAFITGALSLIDALIQMPIASILKELNLSAEISDALVQRSGLLGNLVSIMEKLEQNQFPDIVHALKPFGLRIDDLFSMEHNATLEFVNFEEAET